MSIDISIHHVESIKAESGHGEHANWVDITVTGKTGIEQEITLFCKTALLSGLIAKALNEAQAQHDAIVEAERDKLVNALGTAEYKAKYFAAKKPVTP